MNTEEQEVYRLAKTLDDVKYEAFIATVEALASGAGFQQAVAAGNIILLGAGHEPVPLNLTGEEIQP